MSNSCPAVRDTQGRPMNNIRREIVERLGVVEEMEAVDTSGIEPLSNPLDATQTLRSDVVTSEDDRELFQSFAPETRNGLYLVPKVID